MSERQKVPKMSLKPSKPLKKKQFPQIIPESSNVSLSKRNIGQERVICLLWLISDWFPPLTRQLSRKTSLTPP